MKLLKALQVTLSSEGTCWELRKDGRWETILSLYLADPGVEFRKAEYYYGRVVLMPEVYEGYRSNNVEASKTFFIELWATMNELFRYVMEKRKGKDTIAYLNNTVVDLGRL